MDYNTVYNYRINTVDCTVTEVSSPSCHGVSGWAQSCTDVYLKDGHNQCPWCYESDDKTINKTAKLTVLNKVIY